MTRGPGLFKRIGFTFVSMLAGWGVLGCWVVLGTGASAELLELLSIYFVIALAGWLVSGPLCAWLVPWLWIARTPWPWFLLLGACVADAAMLALLLIDNAVQSNPAPHSVLLVHTGLFWMMAAIVGSPAVTVYALLVKRSAKSLNQRSEE